MRIRLDTRHVPDSRVTRYLETEYSKYEFEWDNFVEIIAVCSAILCMVEVIISFIFMHEIENALRIPRLTLSILMTFTIIISSAIIPSALIYVIVHILSFKFKVTEKIDEYDDLIKSRLIRYGFNEVKINEVINEFDKMIYENKTKY